METKVISKSKEFQQEMLLRMEFLVTEKMHSLQNKAVTYEDVLELDIMQAISSHLVAVFEFTTEEVPFEILGAWSMIKVHKELMSLYNRQSRIKDDLYLDLLDKVANKLFIGLFITN